MEPKFLRNDSKVNSGILYNNLPPNISILRTNAQKDNSLIFYFSYGSYFGGECEIIIINNGNGKCSVYAFGYNGWELYWKFTIPIAEIKSLEEIVQPARKWLRKYEVQEDILDGYGWELVFIGTDYTIKTSGYMANPRNYFKITNKMIKQLYKFKKVYSDDDVDSKLLPVEGYQTSWYNAGTK